MACVKESSVGYNPEMLAKRLLELTTEFANAEQNNSTLASLGFEQGRGHDEIAEEYGRVLKEFLTT